MQIKNLLILLFVILNPSLAKAEVDQSSVFKNLTVSDGLSERTVTAIYQDKTGYIWIGTRDGLLRYDGEKFITHKAIPFSKFSLSASYISSIAETKDGNLWIGTDGGGVNVFNPKRETFEHIRPDRGQALIHSDRAWYVYVASDQDVWIGTLGGGLSRIDSDLTYAEIFRHSPEHKNTISSNYIEAISQAKDGTILIGTDGNGLNLFQSNSESFVTYKHEPSDEKSLQHNDVTEILTTKDGTIWVASDGGGLSQFDLKSRTFSKFELIDYRGEKVKSIMALAEGADNTIWVGTWNHGAFKIDIKAGQVTNYIHDINRENSLLDNRIWDIFVDREQNVFIGTHYGLSILPAASKLFTSTSLQTKANKTNKNRVLSIAKRNDGRVFVGTDGNGLVYTDEPNKHKLVGLNGVDIELISALLFDQNNNLWIGSYSSGLYNLDFSDNKLNQIDLGDLENSQRVISLYQDTKTRLWVGTSGGGLYRIDSIENPDKKQYYFSNQQGLVDLNISVIFEDSKKTIWVGTHGGALHKFDESTQEFTNIPHNPSNEQSISHISITSIAETSNGELWVGTYGSGITRISNVHNLSPLKFTHFHERQGLLSNVVYSVLVDENNNLWMSTALGIASLDTVEEKFESFSFEQGITNIFFNAGAYHKSDDGFMYFGSDDLVSFKPEALAKNEVKKTPIINSVNFLNSKDKINIYGTEIDAIEVPYNDNNIVLSFSSLDFSKQAKRSYAYKLFSKNENWIELDNNSEAVISELSPGTYNISVKSRAGSTDWVESRDILKIVVKPPFWSTNWFLSFVLFVIFFSGYLFFYFRMKAIRTHNENLQAEINTRKAIETSLQLTRLAFDSSNNGICLVDYEADDLVIFDCNVAFARVFDKAKSELEKASFLKLIKSKSTINIGINFIINKANDDKCEFEITFDKQVDHYRALKLNVSKIYSSDADNRYIVVADDITELRLRAKERFEKSLRRVREQKAIIDIANVLSEPESDFENVIRYACKSVAEILNVERVSVWFFTSDKRAINCVCLYINSSKEFQISSHLVQSDFPEYFKAISSERVIEAFDIESHPATLEFTHSYSKPNNIKSLLDAPISIVDGVLGVLCIEQTNVPKNWLDDEVAFACEVADQLAKFWLKKEGESLSEQLIQSQKMETIGTMASGVAHDFNNILTPILGSIELIDKDPTSPKNKKRIDRIKNAATRAKNIVQQMLDLSRANKKPIMEIIHLEKLVEESLDLVSSSAGRDIEIVSSIEPGIKVWGDSTKLNQVMVNLLMNAIHATAEKDVKGIISIKGAKLTDKDGGVILISIEDNGCGMTKEFSNTIFEPFVSTKGKGFGTGLGLSVAKNIINEMKGTIIVFSEVNLGSRFEIKIPSA